MWTFSSSFELQWSGELVVPGMSTYREEYDADYRYKLYRYFADSSSYQVLISVHSIYTTCHPIPFYLALSLTSTVKQRREESRRAKGGGI